MKYFVLGTVVLATAFIIGCDSSGGVCCKGKTLASVDNDNPVVEKGRLVRDENDENVTYSFSKTLSSYDWNVTTTGESVPEDVNCTFTANTATVIVPKICFGEGSMQNSVKVVLNGKDEDNQTVNETTGSENISDGY